MSPQTSLQTTAATTEPAVTVEVQKAFLTGRWVAAAFTDGLTGRRCLGVGNAALPERAVELAREAAAKACPALAGEIAAAPAAGMPPPAR